MKTKKPATHVGIIRGCDKRTPEGSYYRTKLRETANFWVDMRGTKYRKQTGTVPGIQMPMYRLDLASIKPISRLDG